MQRIVRTVKTQRSAAVARPPRPTAADRARGNPGQKISATSLILAGPERWRIAVEQILAEGQKLAVVANIVCDPREVDIYNVPQGDVVLIAVDGEHTNYAIEFAMQLQAKDRGTGIALVLPNMSTSNLRTFYTYAGSWSLISAATCGDRERLTTILESTGRGISWVDPIITRLLKTFENGTADFDQDYDDSGITDFVEKTKVASQPETASSDETDDDMDLRVVEIAPELEIAPEIPVADNATDSSDDESQSTPKRPAIGRVLVTDDSDDVRLALQILLEDAGYEVIEAKDGAEAVKLAQSDAPDLILLDVMMPVMDGFTALKHLKSDPATKSIPVIMVTARGGRNDQDNARDLGAFDFIHKPWSDGEVEMTVKWALSRK